MTASGAVMSGGTTGCKLELNFSVAVLDTEVHNRVVCESVWAYEADLHSCDLIIGYPYLSGFGLAVDPGAGVLILSPPETKDLSKSEGAGSRRD